MSMWRYCLKPAAGCLFLAVLERLCNHNKRPRPAAEETGLFELTETSKDEEGLIDIVAVHGLQGDALETWITNDATGASKLWLRDFLPRQIAARIMSYGYNSAIVFTTSIAGIDEFALTLLTSLRQKRKTIQVLTKLDISSF